MKPLFLISNDDGIHADGLRVLADTARLFGDVIVVAPRDEQSARSQAITVSSPLRYNQQSEGVFSVEGTPADCVLLAFKKIMPRKPDWVLSGINHGANLGQDVLYSGTVGAALEGALNGSPAIAFSLGGQASHAKWHFETAQKIVSLVLKNLASLTVPERRLLNVNVPNIEASELRGVVFAEPGFRVYEDRLHESFDPRGRPYYWLGGYTDHAEHISENDCSLVAGGYATLSLLKTCLFDHEGTYELQRASAEIFRNAKI
ncbi:MAG: 5'/3'-nucleotidase SurE [Oligoflexales bacterium]|nr:5'/3'-nucleotidase SurE [Oligoflexales bacterium]